MSEATKREATDAILNRMFLNWNQPGNRKVLDMWYRYVGDIDPRALSKAVDHLVVTATFMPRVSDVRRAAIDYADPAGAPPSLQEAWALVQAVRARISSGVVRGDGKDERWPAEVFKTLTVGGSDIDWFRFKELYPKIVLESGRYDL